MIAFIARFLFGQNNAPQRLTDDQEMAITDKARSLLNSARSFGGMFSLIEQADQLARQLPDNYLLQVIGAGNVHRKGKMLTLSYVDQDGKIARFTISGRFDI